MKLNERRKRIRFRKINEANINKRMNELEPANIFFRNIFKNCIECSRTGRRFFLRLKSIHHQHELDVKMKRKK